MKYRILSDEELQHLEGDLKAFLIINGVHGEEWAKLNQEDPQKAAGISGVVLRSGITNSVRKGPVSRTPHT
ncbi:DUF6495 family protein [Fluviicola sp.]|uniref:DUF6495 family protein n=1 Tax=Fluviicola sp. TaxID=1917219 RepID=UPI003D2672B9